jgi:tagatose-1,6-bisphosphate aldolase
MNPKIFTKNNYFLMLALDHRDSFMKIVGTEDEQKLVEAKKEIISSLIYQFSGILIDQKIGFKAYSLLNIDLLKPFLLPIEKSGYKETGDGRFNELAFTVEEIKDMGASGVKLLIYFNKKDRSAKKQIETAKTISEECKKNDTPFFLEIVNYADGADVLDSVKIFKQEGVNPAVFKIEYPGSDQKCLEVTNFLEDTPWILLSRGVTYEQFLKQVISASQNGCQGFLAGRSLWQDYFTITDTNKKLEFLNTELPRRFAEMSGFFK